MSAPTEAEIREAPAPPLAGQWIREEWLRNSPRMRAGLGEWKPIGYWHLTAGDLAWHARFATGVHARALCGEHVGLGYVRVGQDHPCMRLARVDEKPARARCRRCDFLSELEPDLIAQYSDARGVEALLPLEGRRPRKGPAT
jgi:hypothetical protein